MGAATILARLHAANAASARVLAKAGYRPLGPAPDDPDIRLWRAARGDA